MQSRSGWDQASLALTWKTLSFVRFRPNLLSQRGNSERKDGARRFEPIPVHSAVGIRFPPPIRTFSPARQAALLPDVASPRHRKHEDKNLPDKTSNGGVKKLCRNQNSRYYEPVRYQPVTVCSDDRF